MQILLVEDDHILAVALRDALKTAGFATNIVGTGEAAIHIISESPPDIMILDLGLPDISGLKVLKSIRHKNSLLPVIILTARDTIAEKIEGLETGADDYLTKPFDVDELIARLTVIKRRLLSSHSEILSVGSVKLDAQAKTVTVDNRIVDFSQREYVLLKALMESSNRILSKESLVARLYSWGEEVSENTIEVHIHNIRKKLGVNLIKTVRGIGYTIQS